MNIGFDLDGVIAQTSEMLIEALNTKFGSTLPVDTFKNYKLEDNVYSEDKEVNKQAIIYLQRMIVTNKRLKSIIPYPDSVITINKLKKMGHKIFIITSRPLKFKELTAVWLRQHGIPFDDFVLTGGYTKGDYAKKFNLDCFVDDLQDNLYDMYMSKHRWKKGLLLMTQPWNEDIILDTSKYIRVHGWGDIFRCTQLRNRLRE